MKYISSLSLVLILTAFISVDSFAQGSGSSRSYGSYPQSSSNSNYDNGFTNSGQSAFEVIKQAKGSLVSVEKQYITLRTKKNKLVKVKLTNETTYKRKNEYTFVDDLTAGQFVKVTYKPRETAVKDDQAVQVRILK